MNHIVALELERLLLPHNELLVSGAHLPTDLLTVLRFILFTLIKHFFLLWNRKVDSTNISMFSFSVITSIKIIPTWWVRVWVNKHTKLRNILSVNKHVSVFITNSFYIQIKRRRISVIKSQKYADKMCFLNHFFYRWQNENELVFLT